MAEIVFRIDSPPTTQNTESPWQLPWNSTSAPSHRPVSTSLQSNHNTTSATPEARSLVRRHINRSKGGSGGTRGRTISRKEVTLLLNVCLEETPLYRPNNITNFWDNVAAKFVVARGGKAYSSDSAHRMVDKHVAERRAEREAEENGTRQHRDDLTRAIDRWILFLEDYENNFSVFREEQVKARARAADKQHRRMLLARLRERKQPSARNKELESVLVRGVSPTSSEESSTSPSSSEGSPEVRRRPRKRQRQLAALDERDKGLSATLKRYLDFEISRAEQQQQQRQQQNTIDLERMEEMIEQKLTSWGERILKRIDQRMDEVLRLLQDRVPSPGQTPAGSNNDVGMDQDITEVFSSNTFRQLAPRSNGFS
ncbi:MAG: hypothetical protein M1820_001833 [Bogoriella megaspora]|nr:MAG: hypothetical protein M1820_001833 [Bogoriella megaspora]